MHVALSFISLAEMLYYLVKAIYRIVQKSMTFAVEEYRKAPFDDTFKAYLADTRQALLTIGVLTPEQVQPTERMDAAIKSYTKAVSDYLHAAVTYITDNIRFLDQLQQAIFLVLLHDLTPSCLVAYVGLAEAKSELNQLATKNNTDTEEEAYRDDETRCDKIKDGSKSINQEKSKFIAIKMVAALKNAKAIKEVAALTEIQANKSESKKGASKEPGERDWEVVESGEEDGNWNWLEKDPKRK